MGFSLVLVLAATAFGLQVDFSSKEWKEKPIQKVVKLLNEMQGQIEKEGAEDEAMMEQMGCWCETNEREKTQAIELADQRITDLTSAIPEYAAKAVEAEVTIKQLTKEVAANSEGLDKATGVRAKEQDEFRTGEKDLVQSIASLKNAVAMMSKVQFNQESLLQVKSLIKHHMEKHGDILQEGLTGSQHRLAMSLIQDHTMLQRQSHRAPSSAIFGILKGMKESMETNMANNAKDEEEAVAKFKALKSAKTEEIKAGEDLIMVKKVEMAGAKEKNAKAKVDLEDTNDSKKADTEFLQNMRLKCDNAQHEYDVRTKTRNEELKAVSETIGIVTSDESKDLFAKSMSFVQVTLSSNSRSKSKKSQAATVVRRMAAKHHDPRLMAISMSMRLDAFAKVKENIDKTVEALKAEQSEERKQKDDCVMSLQENEKNVAEKSELSDDLTHTIADLGTTIGELSEAIDALKTQIADTQTEMKRASQNREKENHEFQTTVTEQRATQAILKKALDKLKSFYAMIQKQNEQNDSQDEALSFVQFKKNAGGSGVMAMIETIIDESAAVEAEVTTAEKDAQAAYEGFMKDSDAAIEAASKDVTNKSAELAKAEAAKVAAEDDAKHTTEDLLTLGELGQTLHKKCDFLIKNFELRQTARAEEIEALLSAKAIFSSV
jgi:hypothetical protein